jgi:hypothetical protein
LSKSVRLLELTNLLSAREVCRKIIRRLEFAAPALLLACLCVAPALGQVVARQGTADENEFHSPMILEIPLTGLDTMPANAIRNIAGLADKVCDDVSISSLILTKKRARGGLVHFDIMANLLVRASADKLVTLRFALMSKDEAVAKVAVQDKGAEEKKTTTVKLRLTLKEDRLQALYAGDQPAALQVTLSVRNDD